MRLQANTTFLPQNVGLLALIVTISLTAGCGQKGDLYLPKDITGQVAQEEKPCEQQNDGKQNSDMQGCQQP